MADLARLKKRRSGHRASCTGLFKKIESILHPDHDVTPDQTELVNLKIELQRQRDKILELDDEVSNEISEDHLAQDIEAASEYQMKISKVLLSIENQHRIGSDSSVGGNSSIDQRHKQVKLPTITLPKFSGNPLDWQQFWDLFRASIHSRSDVSDATKFHYLVGLLTGEASQLMSGFQHTDSEYLEAIELLQSTYGKPKKQIESRLHAIFDLKSPQPTATELSQFRSNYEGHIRGLRALGAKVEEAGFVLAALLIRKLPIKIRDNINREGRNDFWELNTLRQAIDVEIGHLQSIEPLTDTTINSSIYNDETTYAPPGGTASFAISSQSTVRSCHLCKGSHYVGKCDKFKSVRERRDHVMKSKLCFNCLRDGHVASSCRNIGRCRSCNRKHHTVLCDGTSKKFVEKTVPATTKTEIITTTSVLSGAKGGLKSVALPTALVTVRANGHSVQTRALLDIASQRTFVIHDLVRKLELKTIKTANLSISGFGSKIESRPYNVVNFSIDTN